MCFTHRCDQRSRLEYTFLPLLTPLNLSCLGLYVGWNQVIQVNNGGNVLHNVGIFYVFFSSIKKKRINSTFQRCNTIMCLQKLCNGASSVIKMVPLHSSKKG